MGRTITLEAECLISKWGFRDGGILEDFLGLYEPGERFGEIGAGTERGEPGHCFEHQLLILLVRLYLLPLLGEHAAGFGTITTIHNPARLNTFRGDTIDHSGAPPHHECLAFLQGIKAVVTFEQIEHAARYLLGEVERPELPGHVNPPVVAKATEIAIWHPLPPDYQLVSVDHPPPDYQLVSVDHPPPSYIRALPYGSFQPLPGDPTKLTWRGIPVQQEDGTWKEIWEARPRAVGRNGYLEVVFTAELRECMGRDHTAILFDTQGRRLGHFLSIGAAQVRARRIWRNGTCPLPGPMGLDCTEPYGHSGPHRHITQEDHYP